MLYNYFSNFNFGCINFNFGNFSFPQFGLNTFSTFNFNPFMTTFSQPFFNNSFQFNTSIWGYNGFGQSPISFNNYTPTYNNNESIFTPAKTDKTYSYELKTSFSPTIKTNSSLTTPINTPQKTLSNTPTSTISKTKSDLSVLNQYNETKGNKLAEIALKNAGFVIDSTTKQVTNRAKNPQTFVGSCARYAQTAITDAGLDDGISRVGSAYLMTDSLRKNNNFAEISSSTSLKDLPPGTVIVYNRGAQGYSQKHGHVEIITKDGRAVSDAITDNLYKKPSHIFIPV